MNFDVQVGLLIWCQFMLIVNANLRQLHESMRMAYLQNIFS